MKPNYQPDMPEIDIPYQVAANRYGAAIAVLMGRKAHSSATRSLDKTADQFRWSLAYGIAPDPETRDEAQFLEQLKAGTQVFLLGRGFKWKGCEPLSTMPQQVMVRLEERARLICQQRAAASEVQAEAAHPDPANESGLVAELERWLAERPAAAGDLADAARWILQRLEQRFGGED